ncbi:MAG: hypothetical protein ACRDS9_16160 [Pseudonocardiaceae bacterium]
MCAKDICTGTVPSVQPMSITLRWPCHGNLVTIARTASADSTLITRAYCAVRAGSA